MLWNKEEGLKVKTCVDGTDCSWTLPPISLFSSAHVVLGIAVFCYLRHRFASNILGIVLFLFPLHQFLLLQHRPSSHLHCSPHAPYQTYPTTLIISVPTTQPCLSVYISHYFNSCCSVLISPTNFKFRVIMHTLN